MMGLDPKPVWNYFEKISEIPRCSKSEERIGEFILSVAKEHKLEARQDEAGNIVIRKPATLNSDTPATVLQAHMDMFVKRTKVSIMIFQVIPYL